jgi:hypothetical protein
MGGTLTNVVKGTMNANADARLKLRPQESIATCRARLQELLLRFQKGDELVDIAKDRTTVGDDHPTATTPELQSHTRDEFFGDRDKAFFPAMTGNAEDDIVRGGYIRAIQLALGKNPLAEPKPIVTYWIVTGRKDGDPDAFEVFVAETPNEVHVMILTPTPSHFPEPPDAEDENVEDMWIVATSDRVRDIDQNVYPSGYTREYAPLPGVNGVECLRVIGY